MDAVFHYLKENLSLQIKHKSSEDEFNYDKIVIELHLEGKLIANDSICVHNGHILSEFQTVV
jgi:hypothetical protein